jgi:hypothetical protein
MEGVQTASLLRSGKVEEVEKWKSGKVEKLALWVLLHPFGVLARGADRLGEYLREFTGFLQECGVLANACVVQVLQMIHARQ